MIDHHVFDLETNWLFIPHSQRRTLLDYPIVTLPSNQSKMKIISKIISISLLLNVSTVNGEWTSWLNRDIPYDKGDFEDRIYFPSNQVCNCPTDIEARIVGDTSTILHPLSPPAPPDELRRFNPQAGLACVNEDQDDADDYPACSNYEVRFFCPSHVVKDRLYAGERLEPGESLTSKSGVFTLNMQNDGNLVVRRLGVPIWDTSTWERPSILSMQSDSNLVVYRLLRPWGPTWSSGSWKAGDNQPRLSMQDDGNLVIYDKNWSPIWRTGSLTWQSETGRSPNTYLVGHWHMRYSGGSRRDYVPIEVDLGDATFREEMKINNDGSLEVLIWNPDGQQYFVKGYWTFCGGKLTLSYTDNSYGKNRLWVDTYTVNLASGNELLLEEVSREWTRL